jgi:hypothetical protein
MTGIQRCGSTIAQFRGILPAWYRDVDGLLLYLINSAIERWRLSDNIEIRPETTWAQGDRLRNRPGCAFLKEILRADRFLATSHSTRRVYPKGPVA